jgi:cell division protein ZapE
MGLADTHVAAHAKDLAGCRARFLPAIELLKRHCEVLFLDSPHDHRLRTLAQASLYFAAADPGTPEAMRHLFEQVAGEVGRAGECIEVEGRSCAAILVGQGVAWFDYPSLFVEPRGARDYIEIARCFHTVFVSGLPALGEADADPARRFITAIDEFYDRRVKLVLSASVPLTALYQGQRLQTPFKRTESRLLEMQSHDYLASPHRSD